MSFIKRKIELTFQLGQGAFGEEGTDTVTVSDLRVQCSLTKTVGPALGEAHLRVYGLRPSLLNRLSALNSVNTAMRQNRLIIKAGDEKAGMAIVFEGQMSLSQIDMTAAPEVALNIMAFAGGMHALKTLEAVSYPGTADAAIILSNLAHKMGMNFENNGAEGPVSVLLATPYYSGALMDQARRCAEDADIEMIVEEGDGGKNTMAIWPKGKARKGLIPLISAETGLIGYPAYSGDLGGLSVKCIFNPQLRIATPVRIKSDLEVANGQWLVFDISHELDSEIPGGQWYTNFNGTAYGQ